MDPAKKNKYRNGLLQAAKEANAAYVVIAEEIPEYFTDCFIEKDGLRFMDSHYFTKPWPIHLYEIWVDHSRGGQIPQGTPLHPGIQIKDGFVKYHIDTKALGKHLDLCTLCESKF